MTPEADMTIAVFAILLLGFGFAALPLFVEWFDELFEDD